jgi:hypothetical protein
MGDTRFAVSGATAYAFCIPVDNLADRLATELPPKEVQPVKTRAVMTIAVDLNVKKLLWDNFERK